jgi:hypothetical protein
MRTKNHNQNSRIDKKEYKIPTHTTTASTTIVDVDTTTTPTTRYVTVSEWVQLIRDSTTGSSNTTSNNINKNDTISLPTHRHQAIDMLNDIICAAPYTALFWETPAMTSYHQYLTQPFEFVIVNAPELYDMTVHQNHNHHDILPFQKALLMSSNDKSYTNNPYAASFPNLGGDAILIVPKYISQEENNNTTNGVAVDITLSNKAASGTCGDIIVPYTARYAHLANFIRYHHHSSLPQYSSLSSPSSTESAAAGMNEINQQHRWMVHAVWQMVTQTYDTQIRNRFTSDPPPALDDSLLQSPSRRQGVWLSTSGLGVLYLHFRIDTVPKYYSHEPYKTTFHHE